MNHKLSLISIVIVFISIILVQDIKCQTLGQNISKSEFEIGCTFLKVDRKSPISSNGEIWISRKGPHFKYGITDYLSFFCEGGIDYHCDFETFSGSDYRGSLIGFGIISKFKTYKNFDALISTFFEDVFLFDMSPHRYHINYKNINVSFQENYKIENKLLKMPFDIAFGLCYSIAEINEYKRSLNFEGKFKNRWGLVASVNIKYKHLNLLLSYSKIDYLEFRHGISILL